MRIEPDQLRDGHATGRCDACGGPTLPNGGTWQGERHIELCHECTARICPALLIDSAPAAGPMHVKALLRDIELQLWRAATYRLAREHERRPEASEN